MPWAPRSADPATTFIGQSLQRTAPFRLMAGAERLWRLERPWFLTALAGTSGLVLSALLFLSQLALVVTSQTAVEPIDETVESASREHPADGLESPLFNTLLPDSSAEVRKFVPASAPPLRAEMHAHKRAMPTAPASIDTRFTPEKRIAENLPIRMSVDGNLPRQVTPVPPPTWAERPQPPLGPPVVTAQNDPQESVPWWDFGKRKPAPTQPPVDDFEDVPFVPIEEPVVAVPPPQLEPLDVPVLRQPVVKDPPVMDDPPIDAMVAESPPIDAFLVQEQPPIIPSVPPVMDDPFLVGVPVEPEPQFEPEPEPLRLAELGLLLERSRLRLSSEQIAAAERQRELGFKMTSPLSLAGLRLPESDWLVAANRPATAAAATRPSFLSELQRGKVVPQPLRSATRPGVEDVPSSRVVALTVEASTPRRAAVGTEIHQQIRVQNDGAAPLEWLAVARPIDRLKDLLTVSEPPALGRNDNLVWQFTPVRPGTTEDLSSVSRVPSSGNHEITAMVEVRASVAATTMVQGPELRLVMWAEEKPIDGKHIRFRFRVTNSGPAPADEITVVANIPETCQHRFGKALEARMGNLTPGESKETELVVTPIEAGEIVQAATLLCGEKRCGSARAAVNFYPIQQTNAEAPATSRRREPNRDRLAQRDSPKTPPQQGPKAPRNTPDPPKRRPQFDDDCFCLPLLPY